MNILKFLESAFFNNTLNWLLFVLGSLFFAIVTNTPVMFVIVSILATGWFVVIPMLDKSQQTVVTHPYIDDQVKIITNYEKLCDDSLPFLKTVCVQCRKDIELVQSKVISLYEFESRTDLYDNIFGQYERLRYQQTQGQLVTHQSINDMLHNMFIVNINSLLVLNPQ